jgi:hypothetical protein
VEDTIVGKAAAMLFCRLGINSIEAGILSRLGEKVLKENKVRYSFGSLVDRISCQTEEILASVDEFDVAYSILAERAARGPVDKPQP